MKQQQNTVLYTVMAFLTVLLLVQLWLLVGVLEAYLGGEGSVLLPATLASGVCFLIGWQLVRSFLGQA